MDKTKNKRTDLPETSSDSQTEADIKKARSGNIWIREDGAICIDNECIVVQSAADGAVDFTVDPNKCSCEAGNAIYRAILESALSGKGSRITIRPQIEEIAKRTAEEVVARKKE